MNARRRPPRSGRRARIRRMAVFVAALGLLLAACRQALPQNSLAPAGPIAEKQDDLFFLVFWIAVGVFVLVEGMLVVALVRFRRRPGRDTPVQIHGNTRLEVLWTIIPAVLLAGVAVPTLGTLFDLSGCERGALEVEVTGHQWWWEIHYRDPEVVTANELHIPADTPVCVTLTSDDVIHSFWVPRLAGKQDLVPGREIDLAIQADRPGTYLGTCAEYCGLSHANMRFRVIAQTQEDFDGWAQTQAQTAAAPEPGSPAEQLITSTCMACHVVRGVAEPPPGAPLAAPDLTHVGGRQTIAGGILENTPEELERWLRNPPGVKPGSKMPNYHLTDEQIEDLVDYLQGLE